jgi:hypothetical protein
LLLGTIELGQVPQEKGQVGQVVLRPLKEQHDHIVAGKPPLFVVGGLGAKPCLQWFGSQPPLFVCGGLAFTPSLFLWWFWGNTISFVVVVWDPSHYYFV